jgi:hypothetical protein
MTVAAGRPARLVAYSTVLDTIKYGELSEQYSTITGLDRRRPRRTNPENHK